MPEISDAVPAINSRLDVDNSPYNKRSARWYINGILGIEQLHFDVKRAIR